MYAICVIFCMILYFIIIFLINGRLVIHSQLILSISKTKDPVAKFSTFCRTISSIMLVCIKSMRKVYILLIELELQQILKKFFIQVKPFSFSYLIDIYRHINVTECITKHCLTNQSAFSNKGR